MKVNVNTLAAFGAALAAPILTACVDQHWLSATQATDLGAMVATAVTFLHINNDGARRALAAVQSSQPEPAPKVISAFGDTL